MAEKAVRITSHNVDELISRFDNDGEGVHIAVGYILVADFNSNDDTYNVLSGSVFDEFYTIGPNLRNGFFEAIRKDEV